ncbi:MAG TPA: hypothetical protein VE029_07025, partial [Rhizobacter sp.]|nr:hypothetical protein [Rhizobacter sp.]
VLPDGESFCTLIRPAPHWTHWDAAAEQVHHISRDTLERHGRSVRDVALLLNDRLHGRTLFSDGWAHDYSWLAALFETAELNPRFRLDSLRSLLSDSEASDWHDMQQEISKQSRLPRHRASSDARLLQMTLLRLRSQAPKGARDTPGSDIADDRQKTTRQD